MLYYVKLHSDKMSSYQVKLRKDELYGVSDETNSLNYDICENSLLLTEEVEEGYHLVLKKRLLKVLCFVLIGFITAVLGFTVEVCSERLTTKKYHFVQGYLEKCTIEQCLYIPLLILAAINFVLVVFGAILVIFIAPKSKGSGVPHVISYLNGMRVTNSLRFRTLVVRVVGVVLSTSGGLCAGKEGPMVHTGAIVGAGVSQGKISAFHRELNFFTHFREDREKRDFVAAGAAAGVAAAFSAPIGGVLFSLECCTSFLNQRLAWQMLLGNLVASFMLNVLLSYYYNLNDVSHRGLLNLGHYTELKYTFVEIPIFCLIGIMGGLMGALHNQLVIYFDFIRAMIGIKSKWTKITDAGVVSLLTTAVVFTSIYYLEDCRDDHLYTLNYALNPDDIILTQMFCDADHYNSITVIWFQTPQAMLRTILHAPLAAIGIPTLLVFGSCFYFLSIVTHGINASMGLFIPALVTGAAWGRVMGIVIKEYILTGKEWWFYEKYALLGAAAQLSGVLRLTISLSVLMIETTGNVDLSLPLIIVVLLATWIGGLLNESVYLKQIQMNGLPYLYENPPPLSTHITASQVMSKPAVSFKTSETVGNIVDTLKASYHEGFPVKGPGPKGTGNQNTFRGVILRSQLITLLESKLYLRTAENEGSPYNRKMSLDTFRYKYPHYTDIALVPVTERERGTEVNLVPYINNSPYTVYETTSLPRAFRLFRQLGLRHLVVVNDQNDVVGMITRVDLARYRTWQKNCRVGLVEVQVIRTQGQGVKPQKS